MNKRFCKFTQLLIPLLLLFVIHVAQAQETPEQLNQRCAPCHGNYGQGIPGSSAPRLAGLPDWYLSKATKDYKKGARKNALMVDVASIHTMSDEEIDQLSQWLSQQAINKDPKYDITLSAGDAHAGKHKYNADCKTCHARNGYGKKKKDAPPLASQYPGYLFASIKAFYHKDRYHDNDPIDDTFDDISDVQARNILAWLATLDNKVQQADFAFKPAPLPVEVTNNSGYTIDSIQQTVVSKLADNNLSMHQLIAAMRHKAQELGVPLLPDAIPTSQKLAVVVKQNYCAARHISGLIKAVPIMANYSPCQITVVKNNEGLRLMMVNLDLLIDAKQLPLSAQRTAILINQDMLAIMQAGVRGH